MNESGTYDNKADREAEEPGWLNASVGSAAPFVNNSSPRPLWFSSLQETCLTGGRVCSKGEDSASRAEGNSRGRIREKPI